MKKINYLSLLTVFSLLLNYNNAISKEINAVDWDDSSFSVAQIVENKNIIIKGLGSSAQLSVVYNGGIMAPFATYLSIWDPEPQDGGDFGSVKIFYLGHYSNVPKVIKKTFKRAQGNNGEITLELKSERPDDQAEKTIKVKVKLSIIVVDGVISSTATQVEE